MPCLINNRGICSRDDEVLRQFQEPKLNNPVIRLIDAQGSELMPRLADRGRTLGRLTLDIVLRSMIGALAAAGLSSPSWVVQILKQQRQDLTLPGKSQQYKCPEPGHHSRSTSNP